MNEYLSQFLEVFSRYCIAELFQIIPNHPYYPKHLVHLLLDHIQQTQILCAYLIYIYNILAINRLFIIEKLNGYFQRNPLGFEQT